MNAVFLPSWPDNPYQELLAKHLEASGVHVRHLSRRLWFLATVLRARAQVLHLHSPDQLVVYAESTPRVLVRLVVLVVQLALLWLARVRIFWTVHDVGNHENRHPRLERACLSIVARLAHGLFVHCDCARREVLQSLPAAARTPFHVVRHGHYADHYPGPADREGGRRMLGIAPRRRVFLFIGNLRRYKGVPELIEAFAALGAEAGDLAIAGTPWDASLAAEIERLAAAHPAVHFLPGYVADDQIARLMCAADVVVLPFRRVLTSGSVILAMSFARACIAPRVGCIGEVLDDQGAFLYHPASPGGLAAALRRAAACSGEQLATMGRYNAERVRQWRWETAAEVTAAAYRDSRAAPARAPAGLRSGSPEETRAKTPE